jgi:hypothetical protein
MDILAPLNFVIDVLEEAACREQQKRREKVSTAAIVTKLEEKGMVDHIVSEMERRGLVDRAVMKQKSLLDDPSTVVLDKKGKRNWSLRFPGFFRRKNRLVRRKSGAGFNQADIQ